MTVAQVSSPYDVTSSYTVYKKTDDDKVIGKKVGKQQGSKIGTQKSGKKTTYVPLFAPTIRQVDEPRTSSATLDKYDTRKVRVKRPDPRKFSDSYNGTISVNTKPQYVYISHVGNQILFSQQTVSDFNKGSKCDYPLSDLVDEMFVKYRRTVGKRSGDGALDLVKNGDGTFTSLDNRRLLIAKKIGAVDRNYGIWVRVHAANKRLHPCLQGRFQGAQTWGQAVTIRTGGSQGFRKLPTIKDEGYVKDPQTLTLDLGNCDLSKLNSQDAAALNRRKVNNRVVI